MPFLNNQIFLKMINKLFIILILIQHIKSEYWSIGDWKHVKVNFNRGANSASDEQGAGI